MYRRAQRIPHLHPRLTRGPLRGIEIESIDIDEPVGFVAGLAVVGGLDEGFDADAVGFGGAPADEELGGAAAAVLGVDEGDGEDFCSGRGL